MPALLALRTGRYAVLQAEIGNGLTPLGILLEDPESNLLYVRLRRDLETLDPDDPVLPLLEEDLRAKGDEMGAAKFFAWAEENLSANLRTTGRQEVVGVDFDKLLARVYSQQIGSRYSTAETHVPRYSLRSAAGKFLDSFESEFECQEELPAHIRAKKGLVAIHIEGTSMEPTIPNGSVALFQLEGAGSRSGKLVLVRENEASYTLKRYTSRKQASDDGSWEQAEIVLESINKEHAPIVLKQEDSRYSIVAWFVDVLY